MTATGSIANQYGAMFITLLISAVLFGITIVQTFTFYFTNPRDPFGHKIAVAWLWLINMLYLIFVCHYIYSHIISTPDLTGELPISWDAKTMIFMEALTISTVQFFYTARIWRLSTMRGKVFPLILMFIVSVGFACGLYAASEFSHVHSLLNPGTAVYRGFFMFLTSTGVADIAISGSLIYTLAQHHGQFAWTDSTITVLASYALNTGIITCIFSIGSLIALAINRESTVFVAIRFILLTIHVNSFMAMLNARHYFQPKNTPTTLVLQAHEASINISKFGDVHATSLNPGHSERSRTINEAGLPLFKTQSAESDTKHPRILEVVVAQEHCSSTT